MRYAIALCLCVAVLPACAGESNQPIAGIGPAGKIVKLHGDFKFTEGPAADAEGSVYFSDIPENKIYKTTAGKLSVVTDMSNHSNGLMFNARGELVACEMDGRITARDLKSGEVRVLADKFEGNRFNAPNDLVIDKQGGVYFTDPDFRAPMPRPQKFLSVYCITPQGEVSRVVKDLPKPNGVILSPDEKTLYVIPTASAEMMAYPVMSPGKLGKGHVFCTLKQAEGQKNGGGDGLAIDTKGNLYITSKLGLQVFSPKGKMLGVIAFPEQPANATFGGADSKTLYVTARTSVYTVPMEATGHVVAKPK